DGRLRKLWQRDVFQFQDGRVGRVFTRAETPGGVKRDFVFADEDPSEILIGMALPELHVRQHVGKQVGAKAGNQHARTDSTKRPTWPCCGSKATSRFPSSRWERAIGSRSASGWSPSEIRSGSPAR